MHTHMKTTLYLFRGLPGSGKSSAAEDLELDAIAADDWFLTPEGVYEFSAAGLTAAHLDCQTRCARELKECADTPQGGIVAVTNTFSTRWELEPYLLMAAHYGAWVYVVDLFDSGRTDRELANLTTHGVPIEGIAGMRARWEHDWRNGNPLPPWERVDKGLLSPSSS